MRGDPEAPGRNPRDWRRDGPAGRRVGRAGRTGRAGEALFEGDEAPAGGAGGVGQAGEEVEGGVEGEVLDAEEAVAVRAEAGHGAGEGGPDGGAGGGAVVGEGVGPHDGGHAAARELGEERGVEAAAGRAEAARRAAEAAVLRGCAVEVGAEVRGGELRRVGVAPGVVLDGVALAQRAAREGEARRRLANVPADLEEGGGDAGGAELVERVEHGRVRAVVDAQRDDPRPTAEEVDGREGLGRRCGPARGRRRGCEVDPLDAQRGGARLEAEERDAADAVGEAIREVGEGDAGDGAVAGGRGGVALGAHEGG